MSRVDDNLASDIRRIVLSRLDEAIATASLSRKNASTSTIIEKRDFRSRARIITRIVSTALDKLPTHDNLYHKRKRY